MAIDNSVVNTQYAAAAALVTSAINKLNSIADTVTTTTIGIVSDQTAPSASGYSTVGSYITSNIASGNAPTLPSYSTTTALVAKPTLTLGSTADIDALAANGFPVAEIVSVLNLNAATQSAITALNALTLDFSGSPVAPSTVGLTTSLWSETFWTNVKSELGTYVNSILGADDIDAALIVLTNDTTKMQNAMYAADLERKQQALRDLISAANSNTGSAGFLFPNMMTTALHLDAQQKYQFDLSQVSRDLIKIITEWAKTNYQFTLDKSISAHQLDIDFNMRYMDALIKVYEATLSKIFQEAKMKLEYAISKVDEGIKTYLAQADTYIKVLVSKSDVYAKESDTLIKAFATNTDIDVRRYLALGDVNSKDALTAQEIKQKYYTIISELAKIQLAVYDTTDKHALTKYSEKIKEAVGENQVVAKMASEGAVAKLQAATGAATAAGNLASSISSSIVQIASA